MRRIYLCIAFLLTLLAACGGGDSAEQQVRKVIQEMELAVEARDVGDLTEHLSENYRDAYGHGPSDAARYVRGFFIANQAIHLLTRVESVEFPAADEARATVLVGMLGREAAAEGTWDLAADLYEFRVALRRENGAWQVTFAEWQRR